MATTKRPTTKKTASAPAAPPKPKKPYFWVTWILGYITGDKTCEYALWFQSRHKYEKREDPTFDAAGWRATHTAQLSRLATGLAADGYDVKLEDENGFKIEGEHAVLAGKMDIVATKGRELLIVDAKSGQPKDEHYWQMLTYLMAVQMQPEQFGSHTPVIAQLAYPNGTRVIPMEDLTPDKRSKIGGVLKRFGAMTEAPAARPSARECNWCNIGNCPYRHNTGQAAPIQTGEF